jgi:hypothetical protein
VQGAAAGAEYATGITVAAVPQLEHESHEEQLEQAGPQDEQAEPQTGRSTTWLVSVTGRAQVVQVSHELHGLLEHDEQLEQAGA